MSLKKAALLRYATASTVTTSLQSKSIPTLSSGYRIHTSSEVIFGCIFTVFFCLSYCTRPNMSAPNSSIARLFIRKIKVAFWVLTFPELVLGWAVRQRIEARKFARLYQGRGWSTVHGFFAVMGGFILFQNGRPVQVLSTSTFTKLLEIGCIKFPSITTEDLQGKGKAHPVLTAITLLQCLWFIVQCIARGAQGLAITPLEMMTLALVTANALLVLAWWHKPLDARDFIRLDLTEVPRPVNLDFHLPTIVDRDFFREKKLLGTELKTVTRLESPSNEVDNLPVRVFKMGLMGPLRLFFNLLGDYSELRTPLESTRIRDGDTEVPVFYSQEMPEAVVAIFFCATNILGSLFAAAHASMWFYDFPSLPDRMVWRIATIVSACMPMFFVVTTFFIISIVAFSILMSNRLSSMMIKATQFFVVFVVTLGFIIGTLARAGLFVEAFRCLNGSAMIYVQWTDYIPHFS